MSASVTGQHACRHHHEVAPASHGSNDPGNDTGEELTKEGLKGHKEELKHMQVCYILPRSVSSIWCTAVIVSAYVCAIVRLHACSLLLNIYAHVVLQNQASKYDSASNPLNKNAPTQSASDMKGVQQQ